MDEALKVKIPTANFKLEWKNETDPLYELNEFGEKVTPPFTFVDSDSEEKP